MIATREGVDIVPAVKDIAAVDVTGAGDSFNAALAVGLGQDMSLPDAVAQANFAGAYAIQHLGVIHGLPTREELEQFRQARL